MPLPDYSLPKSFYWDFTDVYGCLKNFAKNVECERGKRKVSDMKVKFEKRVWSEFQVVLTITIVVKRVFWRYLRNCDCEQMWQVQSRCGGKIGCKYGKWVGIDCPKTRKISKKHYFSNQGTKFLFSGCLILHLQCVTLKDMFLQSWTRYSGSWKTEPIEEVDIKVLLLI